MKKLIVLLIMILPLGVFAQEMKVAYVNMSDIYTAMPEITDIEKKLADLNENYRKELKQMEDEYQKKYSDFVAQQDSLTENIKLRRMQEIQDMEGRIQNLVQVAQEDMTKQQQALMAPVNDKIRAAIQNVGKEKAYTYIMDPQVFLYVGDNAIDATPFVKTKLGL